MTKRLAFIALALAPLAAGCGPDCQSTCQKIYGDKPNCGIRSGGDTKDELLTQCEDQCKQALEHPGPVGSSYKPEERNPSHESVELKTDKQAALWMDCVAEHACELLDDGYCAPIF
jgi:hypothetical protein